MRRIRLIPAFVFLCLVGVCVAPSWAQGMRPSYTPSSPTLSPWFGLYNRDSGPLDNYHNFVRPRQRVYRALQQQHNEIQRQSSNLNALGQEVLSMRQPSSLRPTGVGSTFMNYSHYYSVQPPARRR